MRQLYTKWETIQKHRIHKIENKHTKQENLLLVSRYPSAQFFPPYSLLPTPSPSLSFPKLCDMLDPFVWSPACWCVYNFRLVGIVCLKRDGTRAETRFRLSPKRTSPFKSVGASVQSTAGSRGVRISGSNAGYTTFRGRVRVLATHSIRQFPLHFPSRASPCALRFQTHSTS